MTRWDNVHGKRSAPYEFARRARSFGRVAPSRMTARTGARSAPLRGLAVFYSSAVAINQSKRLCTKGHLAEGSFRGGSSAAGGEGVPFPKAKLLFLLIKPQVIRKYFFEFKSQRRFLCRSLRAKALGFVRSALLHYQSFVSLALAQDDVLRGRLRWADVCSGARSAPLRGLCCCPYRRAGACSRRLQESNFVFGADAHNAPLHR